MVSRELYGAYEAALNAVDAGARQAVIDMVNAIVEAYGAEAAAGELFEFVVSNYQAIANLHGDAAMQVVNDFYTSQRALAGIEGAYAVQLAGRTAPALLRKDVSDAATRSDGSLELLGRYLSGSAGDQVRRAADRQMNANISRDPANPKWALVPHAGACGWCRIMGSRGFVYHSEAKVEHVRHANCKCLAVVDFDDDPALDGYEPDALADDYSDAYSRVDAAKPTIAQVAAEVDAGNKRDHNGAGYYQRVTKPKLEAQKAARKQA